MLPPCLFNFYAEYIMQNARLYEHKLESRLLGEIHNLRYADNTTFMAENKEELKRLLMKVREESKKKLAFNSTSTTLLNEKEKLVLF